MGQIVQRHASRRVSEEMRKFGIAVLAPCSIYSGDDFGHANDVLVADALEELGAVTHAIRIAIWESEHA